MNQLPRVSSLENGSTDFADFFFFFFIRKCQDEVFIIENIGNMDGIFLKNLLFRWTINTFMIINTLLGILSLLGYRKRLEILVIYISYYVRAK